jgi:hypothetical protein
MSNQPNDGPATQFKADPLVSSLFVNKEDEYFGLVLNTGWPPNDEIDAPYQSFLDQVRKCFDKADVESTENEPPNVYLYPTQCLHVTVATFYPIRKKQPELGDEYYLELKNKAVELVEAASQRDDWPKVTVQSKHYLQLESVQLGQKAGILLWNDASGVIDKMRMCLEEEAAKRGVSIHNIPNIIHSTFLRFAKEPTYSGGGDEIQRKFQSIVIPSVSHIFGPDVRLMSLGGGSMCKLACETTPYMHIPNDERHVFLDI